VLKGYTAFMNQNATFDRQQRPPGTCPRSPARRPPRGGLRVPSQGHGEGRRPYDDVAVGEDSTAGPREAQDRVAEAMGFALKSKSGRKPVPGRKASPGSAQDRGSKKGSKAQSIKQKQP